MSTIPPMPAFAPPMPAFAPAASDPVSVVQEQGMRSPAGVTAVAPETPPLRQRSMALVDRTSRTMDRRPVPADVVDEPWVPMAESALQAATLRGLPALAIAIGLWIAARKAKSPEATARAEVDMRLALGASPEAATLAPAVAGLVGTRGPVDSQGVTADAVELPEAEIGAMDRVLIGRSEILEALDSTSGVSPMQAFRVRDVTQRIGVMAAGRQDPRDLDGVQFALLPLIHDLRANHPGLSEKLSTWYDTAVRPASRLLRVAHIRRRMTLGMAELGVAAAQVGAPAPRR